MYGSYVIKWLLFLLFTLKRVNCVWKLRHKMVIIYIIYITLLFTLVTLFLIMLRLCLLWYVCIKYGDNVKIMFRICSTYGRIL